MSLEVRPAINLEYLPRTDEIYPVRNAIRGRAIIISNNLFVKSQLRSRQGSSFDEINLRDLFRKLHFDVVIHSDQTKQEILDLLQAERKDDFHRNADMFVLFILSHGSQGSIYGKDGEELNIDKIIEHFEGNNCPALKDKPKMFFIQACQGRAMTTGHESDGMYENDVEAMPPREDSLESDEKIDEKLIEKLSKISMEDNEGCITGFVHEKADTLVAYATVKGYRAWRRTDRGSWFVRCIVHVFSNRACSEHVTDLLTQVNNIMSHMKVDDPDKPQYKQIAEKKDTLRKKVYFFPGFKGPFNGSVASNSM